MPDGHRLLLCKCEEEVAEYDPQDTETAAKSTEELSLHLGKVH